MAPDGIPIIPITFDRTYYEYDKRRQAVLFYAYQGGQGSQDGQRIACYISQEALIEHWGAQGDAASVGETVDASDNEAVSLSLFEEQRALIEATVVRYIRAGIIQTYRDTEGAPQTEVVLRRKDL